MSYAKEISDRISENLTAKNRKIKKKDLGYSQEQK